MHGLLLNPLLLLLLLLSTFQLTTTTSWGSSASAQTILSSFSQITEEEEAIERAAFLTFGKHYKTGHIYNISIPPPSSSPYSSSSSSNFTTLSLTQAVRLRYGSLRRRGLTLNQFHIRPGTSSLTPPPPPPLLKHQHLLLVYQNLPNSSLYPIQDGYVLASPILTLYAYNASNMTPVYTLPKLLLTTSITVTLPLYNTSTCSSSFTSSFTSSPSSSYSSGFTSSPSTSSSSSSSFTSSSSSSFTSSPSFSFSSSFTSSPSSSSSSLLCATFRNGNLSLSLAQYSYPSSNQELTCSWSELGAFYLLSKKEELVGGNSISPSCKTGQLESAIGKKRIYWWKIAVGSVMGASFSIFSLSFLLLVSISRRREKRHVLMEKVAEEGESLQVALVQNTRAPSAFGTRTKPRLETDYSS